MLHASQRRLAPLVIGRVLRKMMLLTEGYDPVFMDDFAQMLGTAGVLRWAKQMGKLLKRLDARYGAETSQYLIGVAAMWNGCGYCGVGHIFAGNLYRFEATSTLFAIDEREVKQLQHLEDEALLHELERRLTDNGDAELWRLLQRQYQLKLDQAEGETEDDEYLRAVIASWDLVNECSILVGFDSNAADVPPLASIGRQHDLIAKYRAARAQAAAS
jgi:hypothetical protein